MNPLEQQFELLKIYWIDAVLIRLPDGSHLVSVPNVQLPNGWTKGVTEIKFIAPVGYPLSRPDCFWADHDLRLANGGMPQNTGPNAIPHSPGNYLWFSWHLATWNPNSDNLLTYLNVIKRRLHDPR
ncbi:MAG: hypothetical protein OJF59_000829 [Cytophagales bacterium]|jgi:hypothetical protein|nr:MAG: hypothetical protein OJF59_000829 [Cytophagales bacterium]